MIYGKFIKGALITTATEFEFDFNNPRIETMMYLILCHVLRLEDYPEAAMVFSKDSGAFDYVVSKGKEQIIAEVKSVLQSKSISITNDSIYCKGYEDIDDIFTKYVSLIVEEEKLKNNDNVNSLKDALITTAIDYGYNLDSPRIEMIMYAILAHIERMNENPDAAKAFSKDNGALSYVVSKGKEKLIEEMKSVIQEKSLVDGNDPNVVTFDGNNGTLDSIFTEYISLIVKEEKTNLNSNMVTKVI